MSCLYLVFIPPLVVVSAIFLGAVIVVCLFWYEEHQFNKARRK